MKANHLSIEQITDIINWWFYNRDKFTVEQVKQIHSLLK